MGRTRGQRRKHRRRSQRPARRLVLVYGEALNDAKAIAELIQALKPGMTAVVAPRRQPLVLIRDADPRTARGRAARLADAVAAERALADVVCVFAHEDCDDVEPAHEQVAHKIEQTLAAAGCAAHAVVPAWEIEAWWLQWPEAVQATNPSWRLPDDYVGRDVGRIRNAKEELRRCLVRGFDAERRRRTRPYRESDSPTIAAHVRSRREAETPKATSQSYERFRVSVDSCAA
jgi:hypothetical protein